MKVRGTVLDIIMALFIILFLYTGLHKLFGHKGFTLNIEKSPPIKEYAAVLSWGIPILEFLIVAALVFSKTRLIGFISSFYLMLLFTVYVGYMLKFVPQLPCSCGGVISKMSWPVHLIFNGIFTALALIGVFLSLDNDQPNKNAGQQAKSVDDGEVSVSAALNIG